MTNAAAPHGRCLRLRRRQGDLIFLSVWAHDTAIQQFIGRHHPGPKRDGLDQFHVVTDQGGSLPVFVGSVERLEKRLTRSYRRTLFGSMVNLWLFDRRCIRPDKSSASALALLRSAADPTSRLWHLVKDTCPLPLLDHWQSPVLALLREREMLAPCAWPSGRCKGSGSPSTCPRSPKRWATSSAKACSPPIPYPARIWTPEVESV